MIFQSKGCCEILCFIRLTRWLDNFDYKVALNVKCGICIIYTWTFIIRVWFSKKIKRLNSSFQEWQLNSLACIMLIGIFENLLKSPFLNCVRIRLHYVEVVISYKRSSRSQCFMGIQDMVLFVSHITFLCNGRIFICNGEISSIWLYLLKSKKKIVNKQFWMWTIRLNPSICFCLNVFL